MNDTEVNMQILLAHAIYRLNVARLCYKWLLRINLVLIIATIFLSIHMGLSEDKRWWLVGIVFAASLGTRQLWANIERRWGNELLECDPYVAEMTVRANFNYHYNRRHDVRHDIS